MDNNDMTHADTHMAKAGAQNESGKSEVPVITMILVSMALWVALIFLVPMVVLVTIVLMIVLAIVQVAVAPWLMSIRLARREMRCEF